MRLRGRGEGCESPRSVLLLSALSAVLLPADVRNPTPNFYFAMADSTTPSPRVATSPSSAAPSSDADDNAGPRISWSLATAFGRPLALVLARGGLQPRVATRGRPWSPVAALGQQWLADAAQGCPLAPLAGRGQPWSPIAACV